jgi:hypothetical protein
MARSIWAELRRVGLSQGWVTGRALCADRGSKCRFCAGVSRDADRRLLDAPPAGDAIGRSTCHDERSRFRGFPATKGQGL